MKMAPRLFGVLIAVGFSSTLIACPILDPEPDDPLDPETIQERIEANLSFHLNTFEDATAWIDETHPSRQRIDAFESEAERREALASLMNFLGEYILVEAQLEEQTTTSATFFLEGDRICQGLGAEVNDEEFDRQDCARQVDAAELRLFVVSATDDDVRLEFQVSPARLRPAVFQLEPRTSRAEFDLGEFVQALNFTRAELGPEAEPMDPIEAQGRLGLTVHSEEAARSEISLSIPEAVVVQSPEIDLFIPVTDPLFAIRADGVREDLEVIVSWPALEFAFFDEDDEVPATFAQVMIDEFGLDGALPNLSTALLAVSRLGMTEPFILEIDGQGVREFRMLR